MNDKWIIVLATGAVIAVSAFWVWINYMLSIPVS